MPKKKSGKRAAQAFVKRVDSLIEHLDEVDAMGFSEGGRSLAYEMTLIKLYEYFERLMLESLVVAINNDIGRTISSRKGFTFPAHMTDEVCEFLIVGDGYFNFRNYDDLKRTIKGFVPDDHWLLTEACASHNRASIERLTALRNYSAHGSRKARERAKTALNAKRLPSAGAWIKAGNRARDLLSHFKAIGRAIEAAAPY